MRCLNCDTQLVFQGRFCAQCGQRADTARLLLGDAVREFMHSFVNVERSLLAFAAALLTRPGRVAREYVLGKRRRHFGPFATLAVILGVTAFAVKVSGFQVLAEDGLPDDPRQFFSQHFNLLLLMQLPILGGVCMVVFRSARLSFPEHMVLAAYLLSVRGLALALVLPLSLATNATTPTAMEVAVYWVIWYVYFGWGASQFYAGSRVTVGARGILVAVLAHGAVMVLVSIGAAVYVATSAALRMT